jgi:hypothetical protein
MATPGTERILRRRRGEDLEDKEKDAGT